MQTHVDMPSSIRITRMVCAMDIGKVGTSVSKGNHHADLFTYNLQSITCSYAERYVSQA
jgi:hypothetical protein